MPAQPTIDLTPYVGRGFPGNIDRDIADVPVKGIDREQTQGMVRVCPETSDALYESDFSPTHIHYRKGSRPTLERIVAGFTAATPQQRVMQAVDYVTQTVVHPHLVRMLVPDRGMSEEQLIESGIGWCNEQTRVFIALCEVMGIPARVCFVFHENVRCGHTCAEVYLDGKWAFVDVTFKIMVTLPDGSLAEGRELQGKYRQLAHEAYKPAFEAYFASSKPFVEQCPGWNSNDRPTLEAGGDLLGHLGICNYIIDGVETEYPPPETRPPEVSDKTSHTRLSRSPRSVR